MQVIIKLWDALLHDIGGANPQDWGLHELYVWLMSFYVSKLNESFMLEEAVNHLSISFFTKMKKKNLTNQTNLSSQMWSYSRISPTLLAVTFWLSSL